MTGFASYCGANIRFKFWSHLPLYVCALVFVPATAAIIYAADAPFNLDLSLYFLGMLPSFVAVGLSIASMEQYAILARRRSTTPVSDFLGWLRRDAFRPGNIVHTLVTITPLLIAFSALKSIIPLLQPFSWDPTFEQWDRAVGFGHAPWTLLQPLIGYPVITIAISVLYDEFWMMVVFGVLAWQAFFTPANHTRMQFLLAFSLSWCVAGNLLAVVFSSAGPCYYGFLFSSDPYAAQMQYLSAINPGTPRFALQVQDGLWQSYAMAGRENVGISAMPSMHVVATVLIALVTRRTGKWFGIFGVAYAMIIVVGSVHLAWHYAVDAIAGIVLAVLFWRLAGVLVHWFNRLSAFRPATADSEALPVPAE